MTDKIFELIRDAANKQALQESAEAGQLTLGELIAKLEQYDPDSIVCYESATFPYYYPGSYDSYRGYYEMLAISRSDIPVTVGQFMKASLDAVGETFTGYKGGEYTMTKHTPVWVSDYGRASGDAIVDIKQDFGRVLIVTERID